MLEPVADMTKLGSKPSGSLDGRPAPRSYAGSTTAVVWFRRDLRTGDHPALSAAVRSYERVVCIFVWDPSLLSRTGQPRLRFLAGCLSSLDRDLGSAMGKGLVQLVGEPETVVPDLARTVGADVVYVSADFGPYGSRRDNAVESALGADGARLVRVGSPYAVPPGKLSTSSGAPFQVYTPFWKAWRQQGWQQPIPAPPETLLAKITRAGVGNDVRVPEVAPCVHPLPPPGEEAAHGRLESFLAGPVRGYKDQRDLPGVEATSRLSAYLRFGCLHPRQILSRLDPTGRGEQVFEKELCWREFYADVLWHRPDASNQPYRAEWSRLEIDRGPLADERFEAWAQGRTGFPIVDAGMRQLRSEGWMHNRVRMITASFLVKDLHLDWRIGASWFMEHLVDADLASNQLGWQWVAGCGTDAAPYFRVFNPTLQGEKFDPKGTYVRRYVPELAGVSDMHIHRPHELAGSLLAPLDYPQPIVDHHAERDEALTRYSRMRA
jgi:deoxyribodipyrimidine photo-lyase